MHSCTQTRGPADQIRDGVRAFRCDLLHDLAVSSLVYLSNLSTLSCSAPDFSSAPHRINTCYWKGAVRLNHGPPIAQYVFPVQTVFGPLDEFLQTLRDWLSEEKNKRTVITIFDEVQSQPHANADSYASRPRHARTCTHAVY